MISLLNLLICCMKASKVYVLPEEGTPPIALKAACMAINSTELLYIFGGHEKSDKTHNEIYIYNLSETFWTESNPIEQTFPTARYNPGCFIYKESFYVFAGNTNFGPLNDLWAYHAEEMHWEQVKTIGAPSFRYLFGFTKYEFNGSEYFAVYGGWKDKGLSNGFYV